MNDKTTHGVEGADVSQFRGIHTLRDVIERLRMEGFYRDDEGEETTALEDLLQAITHGVAPVEWMSNG